MNTSINNVLRSAIEKVGLDLTKNADLCDAYLSDLITNYRAERVLLVKAVAEGIPSQLMMDSSARNHEVVIGHFARNPSVSKAQARQAVEAWSFALSRELTRSTQVKDRHATRHYLGGVITGLMVLAVGSAIAVYQVPDQFSKDAAVILSQEITKVVEPEPLMDATDVAVIGDMSRVIVVPDWSDEEQKVVMTSVTDAFYGLHPRCALSLNNEDRAGLVSVVSGDFLKRRAEQVIEEKRRQVQAEVDQKHKLAKQFQDREQARQQRAEAQRTRQQAKAVARQRAQANLAHQQAALNRLRQARQRQARPGAKEKNIRTVQTKTRQLMAESTHFGRNATLLKKKQADLAVVNNLLKLTNETYYQQQQQQINNIIDSLQKKQAVLSARYAQRLRHLCILPADSLQVGLRSLNAVYQKKRGVEAVAYRTLRQHMNRCPQVLRAKNHLFARELRLAYRRILND